MATVEREQMVPACSLAELERDGMRVATVAGRPVLVGIHEGRVFALDNRCPHMGFPLHRGTLRDGVLTCHWHHAKFDVASGCTFDLFADDARSHPVEVREGTVWVGPPRDPGDRRGHWLGRLEVGLEQDIRLVLAKSAIALTERGALQEALVRAALFGLRNRAAGWSQGMTILTSLGLVMDALEPVDRPLALFQGLVQVSASTAGQPPDFELDPLGGGGRRSGRYLEWFRTFVEVREADAAERTLLTAITDGSPPEAVAEMVFAACTDHRYLEGGHVLDFANKAFELLDLVGWEHAATVLPSVIPSLVAARRMEESSSWRHPVDVAALVEAAVAELPDSLPAGRRGWAGHQELAELVLEGDPAAVLQEIVRLLRSGVPAPELSTAVALAGALRAVHFPTSNEFTDWETVLHGFTYASAVDQAVRRIPSPLVVRGVLDAAMAVWLERFLNVPRRRLPAAGAAATEDLLAAFDRQGRVDEAAEAMAGLLAAGQTRAAVATLGHAVVREDFAFHQYQMYEAALRQWRQLPDARLAHLVLIGATRYLAAHAPTVRSRLQTYDIALRLHRGEAVHLDAG